MGSLRLTGALVRNGRASCGDPLARVRRMAVHRLTVAGQNDVERSRAVLRIDDVNCPLNFPRHAGITKVAAGSLQLHVGAGRIQDGPSAGITRPIRPRIGIQIFGGYTRIVARRLPLHEGGHLRWQPGPHDSLSHVPKTSLDVERLQLC